MSLAAQLQRPVFNTPVRWVLRVLAWTAFGVSAYLAWHAASGSAIAACGVGDASGCDEVLSSSWSRWLVGLEMPVAVLGLACYASLAGLSVLLGLRSSPAARWVNTAFAALAIVAAGASLWFLAIQAFIIGRFCPFCVVTDLCGLAIGLVTLGAIGYWLQAAPHVPQPRVADASLMALRTALPAGAPRGTPKPRTPITPTPAYDSPRPSLAIAGGTAAALLALLIGGQVLFPAKTYRLQSGTLDQPLDLAGASQTSPADQLQAADAQPHVAMRIPPEADSAGDESSDASSNSDDDLFAPYDSGDPLSDESAAETDSSADTEEADTSPLADAPQRERHVKFLNGSLTVDVYKHPCIGSRDAPHVMIEIVSYDCPHCRKMHRVMEKGLARYRGELAILVMPMPMEMSCNKLVRDPKSSHRGACATARFALGIAEISPRSFHKFHTWLMSGDEEKPPALEKVIPKAYGMVDRERLREFTRSQQVNDQITQYVNLYATLRNRSSNSKEFGLPVQILGDQVLAGVVENESDVFAAWEEHLGVEAP